MKARKLGFFLIIVAVIGATILSSFNTANAFASVNTRGAVSNVSQSGSNKSPKAPGSQEAVVSGHKITATELRQLQNKLGVSVEGESNNEIVDGHGTGLRAPTLSEWQEISQTAQITESAEYSSSPGSVDNSLCRGSRPLEIRAPRVHA